MFQETKDGQTHFYGDGHKEHPLKLEDRIVEEFEPLFSRMSKADISLNETAFYNLLRLKLREVAAIGYYNGVDKESDWYKDNFNEPTGSTWTAKPKITNK